MRRIGLLSDTHGYLDERILQKLEECDEIWHAGDFGGLAVADALSAIKPLKGVYGNIDDGQLRRVYPEHLRFDCEGMKVWMTHIGGYPGKYSPPIRSIMQQDPPDLFICGHSHILKVMFDEKFQCLHMNPGAAGKQGWHQVRTLLRFSIHLSKVCDLEVVEFAR